jgi:outer membrane immunogenic protein
MHKALIAGAVVAALFQSSASRSPAMAADMALPAPAPPACLWCGLYVGGNAGWAWGNDAVTTTSAFPAPFLPVDVAGINTAASPSLSSNGVIGGAQAGYNWQFGRTVLGFEADVDFPSLKTSQAGTFPFPSTLPGGAVGPPTAFFTTQTSVSTDWLVTARPRLGWTADNWLFYVTGGLAVGRENFTQTVNVLAPFVLTDTFSTTQVGWTAGAGVAAMLNANWSVKAEYLYIDLGTTSANPGILTPPFAGSSVSSTLHLTTSIARVGIDYHFDSASLFWPTR